MAFSAGCTLGRFVQEGQPGNFQLLSRAALQVGAPRMSSAGLWWLCPAMELEERLPPFLPLLLAVPGGAYGSRSLGPARGCPEGSQRCLSLAQLWPQALDIWTGSLFPGPTGTSLGQSPTRPCLGPGSLCRWQWAGSPEPVVLLFGEQVGGTSCELQTLEHV